jgi:hypothetical protein
VAHDGSKIILAANHQPTKSLTLNPRATANPDQQSNPQLARLAAIAKASPRIGLSASPLKL